MIILPIGHDHTIRRLPWVTIGIMIVCVLVQVHRTIFAPWPDETAQVDRQVQDADKALMASLMGQLAPKPVASSALDSEENAQDAPKADPTSAEGPAVVRTDPLVVALERGDTLDQIVAAVHAGTLGNDSDPAVARVHAAMKNRAALAKRDLALQWAYVPSESVASPKLVLSAFAHSGWFHLAGNLVFLWLCGCNLEDRFGRVPFAMFYTLAAIASGLVFALLHRHDGAGVVGASGAIAAAMGAFLVCFARARIEWMYIVWWKPKYFHSSALVAFPIWFFAQAFQLLLEASGDHSVAFSAHVGGFAFGLATAGALRLTGLDDKLQKLGDEAEGPGWVEDPEFVAALEAAHASNVKALLELLPRVVGRLSMKQRFAELLPLLELVEPLLAPAGTLSVDERTSAQVLHAAIEGGDPKLCVRLARGHQSQFANGHLMPRVLWDVAMAQRQAGAMSQAQQTLQRLVDEFPMHALAQKAKGAIANPA